MKYLIILSILIMACGSSVATDSLDYIVNNDPTYQMSFQDVCEVKMVNGIEHVINCQGQAFVVHYYFEPPDKPFIIGDTVLTEFMFEKNADNQFFTLIDVLFVDTEQPQEIGDNDE
jgi:hypothetical protein